MSLYFTHYALFILTSLIIPVVVSNGLLYAPLIDFAWKNSTIENGKLTGYLLATGGLGQTFFILIGTYIINPQNDSADLNFMENGVNYKYFN